MKQRELLPCRDKAIIVFCACLVTISALTPIPPVQAGPIQTDTDSAGESHTITLEEQQKQQEQQIRDLQERLRQLESSMMGGTAPDSSEDANDAGNDVPASAPGERSDLGAVRETTQILTPDELVSDRFRGSWPMFGTDYMRMKIGGYVKVDSVYDFDGTLDQQQFLMSTIPVKGTPEYGSDPYFRAFANETRINLDIRRIKPMTGPMRAFVEGDFWDSRFRLRHAYISNDNFLIGQTWTTLSFLESLPYMIDFAAGDALFGGRSVQIRYTKAIRDGWRVSVAAEDLNLLGIENPNNLPGHATIQLPLLAVRTDYRWNSGVLFLGSSIAQLHWDGESGGSSDDALQWNMVVAGRQTVGSKSYVSWNLSYGEGSGENVIAFAGSNANAVLGADGSLTTIPALSALVGFGHQWSPEWSSNMSYAYGWLDTPETRDPYALKRGGVGHVNLIWDPDNPFSAGIEYIWGSQRVQNDAKGSASRVQLMTRYDF